MGAVRRNGRETSHDHSFVLRAKAKGNLETMIFIVTLSTVQLASLHFLYSTCKRQAIRIEPSTLAIRRGGQARVESTAKLALHSSSLQIHTDASSTTHTGRRSRPELAAVFPKLHTFNLLLIPANRALLSADLMRNRRLGNWSSSCQEVLRPMSRSLWPFRAMVLIFLCPSFNPCLERASHQYTEPAVA